MEGARHAWASLAQWHKPFLTLFSDGDPINSGFETVLQEHVPGCQGQPHAIVPGGHYIQEDNGEELARKTLELVAKL
jgi:haloalkane dehalogenase